MSAERERGRVATRGGDLWPYALLTFIAFVWGGNWVVGRGLQEYAAPGMIGLSRWLVAAMVLVPIAAPAIWRERAVIRAEWRKLLLFAVLGVTLASNTVYWGLRVTSAINGGLYGAATSVFVLIIAWSLFGQRTSWRQLFGVAVSIVGVVTVVCRGDLGLLLSLHLGWGDAVLIGGIFLWALYMVLVRAWPSQLSQLAFVTVVIVIGLVCFLPLYAIDRMIMGPTPFTWELVYGALYLGILTSAVGWTAWNWGLERLGPARTSQFMYLMPLFAALQAVVLLGEQVQLYHVAAAVLIIAGIAIATRERPPPVAASAGP